MPFWRKKSDEEKQREEMQKRSLESLSAGGIPLLARQRIEREAALGKKFFTSDLTAREYFLCGESGLETIGQVMGTSFFNVSYFGMMRGRSSATGELADLTRARLHARRLALGRMQEEARLLGASGVVGVRIQAGARDWGGRLTEFTAIGTAVRIPGMSSAEPFTCDLSGQEFWQLHKAGYTPKGVAFGVCSYYMYSDVSTQKILYSWWGGNQGNNQEVPLYTQGFYTARNLAMSRLILDLHDNKADGCVAMEVDYDLEHVEYEVNDRKYHDLIAHFTAMGTGIIGQAAGQAPPQARPLVCLNLATGKMGALAESRLSELSSEVYDLDEYDLSEDDEGE